MLVSFAVAAWGAPTLPVTRVRFYETGVAWFERSGYASGTAELVVPASHLDDALKSLVVLGGDVDVGAITFATERADDATRSAAGLEATSYADVLAALIGTEVEVVWKEYADTISGTLLQVEGSTAEGQTTPVYLLTVLGIDGRIAQASTDQLMSLRATDSERVDRMSRAAATLSADQAQRQAPIELQVRSPGSVDLAYLAEAPVWRITYRVIADTEKDAHLQAWALVHNDTDEDWDEVSVELANGEPDSFVDPLVAPMYATREVRYAEDGLSSVAQLLGATPSQLATGSMGGIGYGGGSGGYAAYGAVGVGTPATAPPAPLPNADGAQTPTQFVYRVARPVSLPARHSAMVPLVHQRVPVEQVVAFDTGASTGRTGLWLGNETNRTLPDGLVTVVQDGGLAGEGSLARLKPGEAQLLLFGNELDVDAGEAVTAVDPNVRAVGWDDGQLMVRGVEAEDHRFEVINRSGRPRDVWFAVDLPEDAQVAGKRRVVEDPSSGTSWVVVSAGVGTSASTVRIETEADRPIDVTELAAPQLRDWAARRLADRRPLEDAAAQLDAVQAADAEIVRVAEGMARAQAQLDGVREDLRAALDADHTGPLARSAADLESEIRKLQERIDEGQGERDAAFAEATRLLSQLRSLSGGAVPDEEFPDEDESTERIEGPPEATMEAGGG